MRWNRVARAAACAVIGLPLAGCETTGLGSLFGSGEGAAATTASLATGSGSGGGVAGAASSEAPIAQDKVPEPHDDLGLGKWHFRAGNYGLAEQHFRKVVEGNASSAEGWLGLAAAYDQLKRFELADRAYAQALRVAGPIPVVLNNRGYSYLLRGDLKRARQDLRAASAKDPGNPLIERNLQLLETAGRRRG